MTAINAVADLTIDGDIGVLTLDSPPVNALSADVRDGLSLGIAAAAADPAIKAVVLICAGRTFIAGADISEFGKPPRGASLFEVQATIENSPKPVVAAIHGTALGGGLEVALVCHFRVAVASAKFGLPEVKLGLLPGAGGTQRLPRVVGAKMALEMVTTGKHIGAKAAAASGLIDAIVDDLRDGAIHFARRVLDEKMALTRVRDKPVLGVEEGMFDAYRQANAKTFRGFEAPEANLQCIEAAATLPFDQGMAIERKLFMGLMTGLQSRAQRYVFFAERQANKIDGLDPAAPLLPVASVGIIGAGTMGGGIAMNFLNAGVPVTIVEMKAEALDRGVATIRKNYENTAAKGRMTADDVARARIA
jgi:3-hydroxyacyl-CoA dehydrogenase